MSYSRDYIFEKIIEKLPTLKIHERREKENSVFILEYENRRAKIDIDSFVRKLGDKKTNESDKKIEEFVYYIVGNFNAQKKLSIDDITEDELLENIFPVVRASSFNKDNEKNLVSFDHTNETRIYLAYDFKDGYKLLDGSFLSRFSRTEEEFLGFAKDNLEKLPLKYDGARIIDKNVLNHFYDKIGASFYVGLPHQDTLIIADVQNKQGLEVLQKMMVHFFTEGLVPITTITFKYDGKELESYFIFVE